MVFVKYFNKSFLQYKPHIWLRAVAIYMTVMCGRHYANAKPTYYDRYQV